MVGKVLAIGTAAQLKTLTVDKISCAAPWLRSWRLGTSKGDRMRGSIKFPKCGSIEGGTPVWEAPT